VREERSVIENKSSKVRDELPQLPREPEKIENNQSKVKEPQPEPPKIPK
jgi:hypothetical protein